MGPVVPGREELIEASSDISAVTSHLEQVLASQPFRSSQRSSDFLRHVVTLSLKHQTDLLRERQIGETIFGRPPDYDTGQDAIVRVKANEVRRRLAQYYDLHPGSSIRLEIPSGSYVVQVRRGMAPQSETSSAPQTVAPRTSRPPGKRFGRKLLAIATISAMAFVAVLLFATRAPRPFDQFWAPFAQGTERVLMSLPHPEVYRLYGDERSRLIQRFRPLPPGQTRRAEADPIQRATIFPEHDLYIGIGDARSLALIYSLLQGFGRQPFILRANATGFTELRGGAGILLGGFTNRWTLEFTRSMPFSFVARGPDWGIFETRSGRGVCVKPRLWEPPSSVDCAIVARLMNSKSGKPLLIAAGLDHYGTFAVGEFLTRPEMLEPALRAAPSGWSSRNLQIVIQVEVVGDNVGPPKVLAAEVW